MFKSGVQNQLLAAVCVGIGALVGGVSHGWPSPFIPILNSNETPLPCGQIPLDKLAWVVSVMMIGSCIGCTMVGFFIDYKGRKFCLYLTTLPFIIGWISIYFAQNVDFLILGRFLIGVGNGVGLVAGPVYISEIAQKSLRGYLGSYFTMSIHIGCLCAYVVGHFLSFKVATAVFLLFPVCKLLLVIMLPETPYYLMRQNKIREAEMSLAFFRNIKNSSTAENEDYKLELETLQTQNNFYNLELGSKKIASNTPEWKDFVTPAAKRGMFIALSLVALNQLCGSYTIISYASTIFADTGSTLTPHIAAIIVGVIQLAGSTSTTILVDRVGRRVLYVISALGTAIGLFIMGGYGVLKSIGYDVSAYNWIPLASVAFAIYIVSWAVVTLTFLVISEILPEKIRSAGSAICIAFLWILSFTATQLFYILSEMIGVHGVMFIFASFSLLGGVFCIVFLPETKGKSFAEIQKLLVRRSLK